MTTPQAVIRTYLWVTALFFLSASVIWGVNTLFLLDAGLSLFETFVANAAWTAGMVLFEIPTGLVADTRGRRISFLLSVGVLAAGTLAYVAIAELGGGVWWFVLASVVLGLGYTFHTGAVEAWVVDALGATGHRGDLDRVFARGGVVSGVAMLIGTTGGGLLGQADLSLPYLARAALLVGALGVGWRAMHDLGFRPRALRWSGVTAEMRTVGRASMRYGWRRRSVRLLMLVSFVQFAVGAWAFYAWQPYFLDLLGREAIWAAGVVAAMLALAGIVGNALVGRVVRPGRRRTTVLIVGAAASTLSLVGIGLTSSFWVAVALFVGSGVIRGVTFPVRQSYLHQVIPSEQRATVVSFDSLFGSLGSVGGQTGLGYLSEVRSIASGFVVGGLVTAAAIPLYGLVRRRGEPADLVAAPPEPPVLPEEPAETTVEAPT